MQKPLFRFLRTPDMPEKGAPEQAQVRRQFNIAKLIQDAYFALVGKPASEYDAILNADLGLDVQSLRELSRGMGVRVTEPGWFAALIRG